MLPTMTAAPLESESDFTSNINYAHNFPISDSGTATATATPTPTPTISWIDARKILHGTIYQFHSDYLQKDQLQTDSYRMSNGTTFTSVCHHLYRVVVLQYSDVVLALLCCVSLLIIGCLNGSEESTNEVNRELIYAGAVSSAVCILSVVGIRARQIACRTNRHAGLFRATTEYLMATEQQRTRQNSAEGTGSNIPSDDCNYPDEPNSEDYSSLHGHCYRVYRSSGNEGKCGWFRVPNLLLVKGDLIALQVGDVAPASVRLSSIDRHWSAFNSTTAGDFAPGERIAESLQYDSLPLGKSKCSVSADNSSQLLSLANQMQLFHVLETPLSYCLNDVCSSVGDGDDDEGRERSNSARPLVHRQLDEVRKSLQMASVSIFIVTLIITASRFGFETLFSIEGTILLQTPFLAALGGLPVLAPLYIFLLEIFGTSRILAAICQHTTLSCLPEEQKQILAKDRWLILRFAMNVFHARFVSEVKRVHEQHISSSEFPIHQPWGHLFKSPFFHTVTNGQHVEIPPTNLCILEKLGVTTALALIDDELVCEDHSTPQQLLIPSSHGLKLLDLCPTTVDGDDLYDDDEEMYGASRKRSSSVNSYHDDDSDSDRSQPSGLNSHAHLSNGAVRTLRRRFLDIRRKLAHKSDDSLRSQKESEIEAIRYDNEVQFEDPIWWKFLPSLKAIGLACLLVNSTKDEEEGDESIQHSDDCSDMLDTASSALIPHICVSQKRDQLNLLARCIGFSRDHRDVDCFTERRRMHIVSTNLLRNRLTIDTHALGLEEGRGRGLLRPDSTSVVVQDNRTSSYQLLTVGEASVVAELCGDSWQGENSTIMPLSQADRRSIIDASNNWKLADLDVAVFSYAPVPHTSEERIEEKNEIEAITLIDNRMAIDGETSVKDSGLDWTLVNNQIFLGMLGSSISPRKEVKSLLNDCDEAGVRFVYFSPRNMRRTKELASQMGIDVGWNCAISLRDLNEGEVDDHRMPSAYADWDVNAKLPHGINDVQRHLEDVDNVPLLVCLFTDVTSETTADMVRIFRLYGDTVTTMGLVHGTRNQNIFKSADLAIGIDLVGKGCLRNSGCMNELLHFDINFASNIAANSCAFRVKGEPTIAQLPDIIAIGRASLAACYASSVFLAAGGLSLSMLVLFAPCSVSYCIPIVPSLGAVLYLLILLPVIGISMVFTAAEDELMHRVPPKNEHNVVFSQQERRNLYTHMLIRSCLPSFGASVLYLIAFGEIFIALEPALIGDWRDCASNSWSDIIRCTHIQDYDGQARKFASALMLGELAVCFIIASAGYLFRTRSLTSENLLQKNKIWIISLFFGAVLVIIYLAISLNKEAFEALPWYYYFLSLLWPFICLGVGERLKVLECRREARADMLRRLQFETRLGMWSPK